MPASYPITVKQGANYALTFVWQNPDGTPINLAGYTAHMQARLGALTTGVLLDASTANGKIVLGGAAGTVTVNLAPADTAGQTWPQAVYDLQLTSPAGAITYLVEGTVTLDPAVTRL